MGEAPLSHRGRHPAGAGGEEDSVEKEKPPLRVAGWEIEIRSERQQGVCQEE